MKKKLGLLIGMVLLLGAAIFTNYMVNRKASTTAIPTPTDTTPLEGADQTQTTLLESVDYFETFRQDRNNVREKELEYLETIILQNETDAETLADAQQQKISIVNNMEKEFTVEHLLKSKGFEDAAVTFHQGSVNVIVGTETLSDTRVAQVLDIVIRETGEPASNIKVSTVTQ